MVDVEKTQESRSKWRSAEARDFLTRAALAVGAGSPTDAGVSWVLPTEAEKPIVLAGGIPDPATLPVNDLQIAIERVLSDSYEEALRYGGVEGFDGLREALAERQSRLEGLELGPGNFLLNNGGAGSIDAICDAFLDAEDVALLEGPTFSGSARTFRGHMAEIVQAPLDEDGLRVKKVEEAIRQLEREGRRAKLLYTIPNFQNPTGSMLPMQRKQALLELCAEYQVLIIEDSAYTELYFGEAAPPSLYALAEGQGVLKVGSFSKIVATGLRVGWIQGREDFIEAIARVKFDMGTSPLLLRALAEYVGSGKLDKHVAKMRSIYAEKCDVLCRSLEEHCSQYVTFRRPDGGFFLWLECIGPKAQALMQEAAREGLIFPAGATFFLNGKQDDTSHVRLAFSTASLEELALVGPRLRAAFERAIGER